jgi:hypothetical protein
MEKPEAGQLQLPPLTDLEVVVLYDMFWGASRVSDNADRRIVADKYARLLEDRAHAICKETTERTGGQFRYADVGGRTNAEIQAR